MRFRVILSTLVLFVCRICTAGERAPDSTPVNVSMGTALIDNLPKKEDWAQSLAGLESTGIPRTWILLGPRPDKEYKLFFKDKGLEPDGTDDWSKPLKDESGLPFAVTQWIRPADEEANASDLVDVGQILSRDNQGLAYAQTQVVWPVTGPALIWYEDAGRAIVYVNNERVYYHENKRRRRICIPVTFHEGNNVVKIKTGQNKGNWGFSLRLERIDARWRIALLQRLLALFPEDAKSARGADARLELARRFEQSNRPAEAQAEYRAARELFPDNDEIRVSVEEGLRRIQAGGNVNLPAPKTDPKSKEGKEGREGRVAAEALNKLWQEVERHYKELTNQGNVEIADEELRDFIARYPFTEFAGLALAYRGVLREDFGFAEECQPFFDRAVHECPANPRTAEIASQGLNYAQIARAPRRTFETSHEVQASLEAARRQLSSGNPEDVEKAVRNLAESVRMGCNMLIALDGTNSASVYTHHTGALEYIRAILAILPPDLMAVYDKSVEKISMDQLASASVVNSPAALDAVAAQFHFTPAALIALNRSGNLRLDQGSYAEAAASFDRLLNESSGPRANTMLKDAGLQESEVRAKLAFALAKSGDSSAHEVAENLKSVPGGENLNFLGKSISAATISRRIEDRLAASRERAGAFDILTHAGNQSRTGAALTAPAPDIVKESWTWPIQQSSMLEASRGRMRGNSAHLQSSPLIVNGMVIVSGVDSIQAQDEKTGKVIWLQQWRAGESPWNNGQFTGYPASCPSVHAGGFYLRTFDNRISGMRCYDVTDGSLRWKSPSNESMKKMIWLSDPVIVSGLAIAPYLERNDDDSSVHGVAALDAGTGELRWKRPLTSGSTGIRIKTDYWPSTFHLAPPAAADGVVYTPTGLGSMAAIRAATGDVIWLSGYLTMQLNDDGHGNSFSSENVMARTLKLLARGPVSPVIAGDVVILAPKDAPGILAFGREHGELRWRKEILDYRFVAGVCDGNLLVVDDTVKAMNAATGKLAWESVLPTQAFGSPGYSGGVLYVPVKECLCRIDAHNGKILSSSKWIQRLGAIGDLVITADRIIGMNERTLVAFEAK